MVLGVGLIVLDDGDPAAVPEPGALETTLVPPGATLPTADLSRGSLERLGGLSFPASTADLLTARLDNDRQVDVTFTIDPAEEPAFLAGSALPPPVAGERVVAHASPLWELNPGSELRGVRDEVPEEVVGGQRRGGVRRAVELVGEGDRLRVRAVLTPG